MPAPVAMLDTDADVVAQAVANYRAVRGIRRHAHAHLVAWLLAFAAIENTVPGAVLDKLGRSQPSGFDQRALMIRLEAALRGDTAA